MLRTSPRGSHRPAGSLPCAGGMARGLLGRLYEGLFESNFALPCGVIAGGGSLNVRNPPVRFQTPFRSLWAKTAAEKTSSNRTTSNEFAIRVFIKSLLND